MFVEKNFKDSNLPENLLILQIQQNFQNFSGLAQSGILFKKSRLSSFVNHHTNMLRLRWTLYLSYVTHNINWLTLLPSSSTR